MLAKDHRTSEETQLHSKQVSNHPVKFCKIS